MKRRHKRIILALIILFILLIWFLLFYRKTEVVVTPSPSPRQEATPPKTPSAPDPRRAQVERWLRENRYAIGNCFLKAGEKKRADVLLSIFWDNLGNPTRIVLNPDPEGETQACLLELVHDWKLSPAADLKAFSFHKKLRLGLHP
jgi:hypothetical protein